MKVFIIVLLLVMSSVFDAYVFQYDHKISFGRFKRSRHLAALKSTASDEPEVDKKADVLKGVLQQIEKCYGKGSIQKLGSTRALDVNMTSSGSYSLDVILGGGYPRGRVIEIYGPESSGKTTLALHAVAEIQKSGGTAAFIDAEHAIDPVYANKIGVNTKNLLICQPDSGEMALDVVDQLIRSSAVDMIVVDSVAALVPRLELEGDMSDAQIGLQARLMSKALRKITGSLSKSHTTVIFINQLRSKVGILFGNPEVTAGGNALKFYSSVRIDIRKKEVLTNQEGVLAKVKIVKNKVFPPFKSVEFEILFGTGINKLSCLIDAAENIGVINRKAAWYNYGEIRLGQGKKSCIETFQNDPKLLAEIETKVKTALQSRNYTLTKDTLSDKLTLHENAEE